MAKLTLPDVGSLANTSSAREAINDNFSAIETALENTLSRDGTTPNNMTADLDMDGNSVINVADPVADTDAVNRRSIGTVVYDYVTDIIEALNEASLLRTEQISVSAGDTTLDLTPYIPFVRMVALYYNGQYQDPSAYSTVGTTVTYSEALPVDGTVTVQLLSGMLDTNDAANVNTILTADGAQTRTVQKKLADVVSLLDFINPSLHGGIAAGTDTSDLTAAVQAAIDAAAGKPLLVPPGTYHIAGTVEISAGLRLLGVAGASIFKAHASRDKSSTMIRTLASGPSRTVENLIIDGITFDGALLPPYRWLQNPDTLATIADPEADYFANGGKINDPAYAADQDGVCLAQNPASGAALVINGALSAAGSVNLAPAVRRVTIYAAADASSRTFTVTGTDYDDAALVESIAGPTAGATVTTTGVFKTISSVRVDATSPTGNVEVGTTAFDIAGVVAEGRRNPLYSTSFTLLRLNSCKDSAVRNCTFRDHYGIALSEGGGLNVTIENNSFDTVGKNDGPFPAIYTQSAGNPTAPDANYSDSENIIIRNNHARNLERSFVLFSPTKGGKVIDNYVDGWGESCVYVTGSYINKNGGSSEVRGNTFKNGTLTDIVCNGVEAGNAIRLSILGNHIEASASAALTLTGMRNSRVEGNTLVDCCSDAAYPYGPFSERYGYAAGTAPVAGNARPIASSAYMAIGTASGQGCDRLDIVRNTIRETRASYPSVFVQTRSGSPSIGLAKNCRILDNILDVPTGMTFLDTTLGSVWASNTSLTIRGNVGHASEAPVVVAKAFAIGETGSYTCSPGFRPSLVRVYATSATSADGMACLGEFSWNAAATRNDFNTVLTSVSGTGQAFRDLDTNAIRLEDTALGVQFNAEFANWTETGFTLNVTVATKAANVRFVCIP